MTFREEEDALGVVFVPSDKYWGAQTERSIENFPIGGHKMPIEVIHALALIKKAAAITNHTLGILDKDKKEFIVAAVDEILAGKYNDQFPLVVWQTGSGTQSNMNVNEVISNIAAEKAGSYLGSKDPVHPNDHVNKSQSSNDVFPSASSIAARLKIEQHLLPNLDYFYKELLKKAKEFDDIVKIGRTHLMDATPLTLGQEFSGYAEQIKNGIEAIRNSLKHLSQLALGGTAVGTGLNAPAKYPKKVAEELSRLTGFHFESAPNKFEALGSADSLVETHGALRRVACSMMKIANDIRWLASGPRCGIGEIILPSNEPGSSIMPGKVNPTQCESMTMVVAQIMGNDATVAFSATQGNFELNVFRPVMICNVIESIHLIGDSVKSFTDRCLKGIQPNKSRIKELLEESLMLVTALNPVIGYDNAAKIAKTAYAKNITLKQAAHELGLVDEKKFDQIVDPKKMIGPS
ncbi:MAG: class II fumarate hydratase [Chlamydiales bacterium]|nr:class II fumarate hydratase [Chlamydiales bacterium]